MPKKVSSKKRVLKTSLVKPRLTLADEKRELILAHLEARAPVAQSKLIYAWVGVSVAVLMIVGVWLHFVGQNISANLAGPRDPTFQLVIDETQKIKQQIAEEQGGQLQELKEQTLQRLEQLQSAAQKQAALKEIAAQMASGVQPSQTPSGPN